MGGLLVGLVGVAALLGLDTSQVNFAAVGEMAVVASGYALGPIVLSRHLSGLSSIGVTWTALTITALVYLSFARIPQVSTGMLVGFPLVLLGSFLATRRDREPAIAAAT